MNKEQLKELIKDTLLYLDLYSADAVNLILGTAAQESRFGYYIKQLGNGPALGIFQMEKPTFDYLVWYLEKKPELKRKIIEYSGVDKLDFRYIKFNLVFACAFTRLRYLVVREKLPSTLDGYARYWKKYYNSILGKGTEVEFIHNYKKYVL